MEEILHQAERLEKDYVWLGATESYKKALKLLPEDDFSRKGDVTERLAYSFYRAAFQAENNDMFRDRLHQSTVAYEKAIESYGRPKESGKTARILRCNAMIVYIGYWLAAGAPEKKRLLSECWRLTEDSLSESRESGEPKEYGETYNQLSVAALLGFCLEWDYQARKKIIREVAERGEVGIKLLSTVNESGELAKAYAKTAFAHSLFAYYFVDPDEHENHSRKAQSYWTKAKEASEASARLEMLCPVACAHDLLWGFGSQEALANVEKALEYGRRTRDRFIIGSALDWLAYHTFLATASIDDRDEVAKITRTVIQYAEDAKRQYSVISFVSPRADTAWIEAIHAQIIPGYGAVHYADSTIRGLVYAAETDLGKRHGLLERAIAAGREALEPAEASGYPDAILCVHLNLNRHLRMLAEIESGPEEKKKLFEEALQHGNEVSRIGEHLAPLSYWDRGLFRGVLAMVKVDLADLARDSETKKSMLQAALLEREDATKLMLKDLSYDTQKKMPLFALLGGEQYFEGGWWIRLCRLTYDKEHLRKAAKAFAEAVESYQKVDAKSRIAECHWKAAQVYDALDEHMKAAENFDLASANYKSVSERVSQLRDFYQEYACYMAAWSEIEKARHHHDRQEYGLAKEQYEKAATMHESLKQWGYLAPNYSAWAQVENAEDLSRSEKSEEALQGFEEAVKLFAETKKGLETKLGEIEDPDEKTMATRLVKGSDIRREYCLGRMELEEAKILDKKGDHLSSSQKYGSLAQTFERMVPTMESEREKKEFKLVATLSKAWQRMTRAEAEESPHLYLEASRLFEEAKDLTPNEQARILTLGHARFCKALEVGTRFVDTRDPDLHTTAIQHLESAATYYVKAGIRNASEYAKATEQLFDAFMHVDNAKRENDPEKKARFYAVAERILHTSARSFMKAEHPEKREQVLRLLEKVKEERELATSLCEVLHTPPIVSTTTTFSLPSPTHESAVGLERFEHADVQLHLTASEETTVGEELDLRLDIVNAGKKAGLLVRVDDLLSPSLKVKAFPPHLNIEKRSIDMKGKRLEPLKVESVNLCVQATEPGVLSLSPQLIFVDELGRFRTSGVEPVQINVRSSTTFEFKAKDAQRIFDYLSDSFVEDYMKRKISLDKSGWKTFGEIIKKGNVSRSSLYAAGGGRGPAVSELERRGLAESRVFTGERGRGGKIWKMRIYYEKETVKRYIDQQIMKK